MRIKRFEDLECWKKSRDLINMIYEYTKLFEFSKDFRLSGQITGAGISIMNNISEGFDAGSNNEFIRFLRYSRRSCSEVQNCLYTAQDQSYISERQFKEAYKCCEETRKVIDGLIRYLKKNRGSSRSMDQEDELTRIPTTTPDNHSNI